MSLRQSSVLIAIWERLTAQPILVLCCLGGLYQMGLIAYIFQNFDSAVLRLMPDDTYYYLKIAENLHGGLGSVFSPGLPTNGYHPLWMAILAVAHVLLNPGKEQFVLFVLVIAVILNVSSAAVLCRLLRAFGFSDERATMGTAAYLFLPWFANMTLTGLETPLFYLCLFSFLLLTQAILRPVATFTYLRALGLGVVAGLLMLARTDSIFFTLPAFGIILLAIGWRALRPLLLARVTTSASLAPWLLWNLASFGTLEQSSANAISAVIWHQLPGPFSREYVYEVMGRISWITYWGALAPFWAHPTYEQQLAGWRYVLTLLAIGLLGLWSYRRWLSQPLNLPVILYAPVLALMTFYFCVRIFTQVWHLSSLFILALVFLLNFTPPLRRGQLGIAVIVSALVTAYTFSFCYFYPQQVALRTVEVVRRFGSDLGHPIKICHTDAGIYGYFNKNEVVNLDGAVNNQALRAIMAGRLSEYIATLNCDKVIITPGRLDFYDRNMITTP